jgi:AGCS family alanine or glycine:cation symporter
MAALYIVGSIIVLIINRAGLPYAFASIFIGAFQPQALGGALGGLTVRAAIRYGVARGLFSNEAGLGSTPHAHAIAKVDQAQDQGEVAIVGVFIDTFIVLTLTALVILSSGILEVAEEQGITGTQLAQAAFDTAFGNAGNMFVAICLMFFAFSTVIGWYFFAAQNVKYLFGKKALKVFAVIAIICVFLGSLFEVDLVWNLADLFNGLMAIPNLIALLALSGIVAKLAHGQDVDIKNWKGGKK